MHFSRSVIWFERGYRELSAEVTDHFILLRALSTISRRAATDWSFLQEATDFISAQIYSMVVLSVSITLVSLAGVTWHIAYLDSGTLWWKNRKVHVMLQARHLWSTIRLLLRLLGTGFILSLEQRRSIKHPSWSGSSPTVLSWDEFGVYLNRVSLM